MSRYYDQICSLQAKLPNADVSFKWKDVFDKGGLIFSSSSLTVPTIGYEKISILFNIAATMSHLAATYAREVTITDDSLKKAIQYFQSATGIFEVLRHTALTQVNYAELTFDLKVDTLLVLQNIMMAQVQEVFFFKAANEKLKFITVSQVAAQCGEFYASLCKQVQDLNLVHRHLTEWFDTFSQKKFAFQGIAFYFQALSAKDSSKYGLQIALLKKAIEQLSLGESRTTPQATLAKVYLHRANQDLAEVTKDNDFIYHDKVPDAKSLPTITARSLVKINKVPEKYFPDEPELFEHLLPAGVHQSIQQLEQYRNELVNNEIRTLRDLTQTLNATLASLNLPAAIEDLKGVEVPQSLKEKAADVKRKGGVVDLDRLLAELPDLLKRNQEILDEIDRSLNAEQESDNNLKTQFGDKWMRTPSARLNQAWRDQITKYRGIITTAIQADNRVKTKYQANIAKIKILATGSDKELANAIPTHEASSGNVSESSVNKLRELMQRVESLKKEREALENQLKGIEIEEIKAKFMKSLDLHAEVAETSISSETMAVFYGDIQKRIRANQDLQERLIAQILSANDEFVAVKGSSGNKREQFLKDLATAYDAYVELSDNLKEGTKFYNELTQVLVNLQVKVNDFCFARKAEREELCKDLQNEIVTRPTPPAPEAPKYQKSEANAPLATAYEGVSAPAAPSMPTGAYPYPATGAAPPPANPWGAYFPPPPLPSGFNPYMAPPQPPGECSRCVFPSILSN